MKKNVFLFMIICLAGSACARAVENIPNPPGKTAAKIIRVLQDFESGGSMRSNQPTAIKIEASDKTDMGKGCLHVTVPKGFDWKWKGWDGKQNATLENVQISSLSCPYLPPEADAIRLKVKIVSGRAIIAVGGPVSQIGNSDVFCDPKLIEPVNGDTWQTVEFSLNQPLVRNYRRANFTVELPVIYYTRWVQEPIYLYIFTLPEKLHPETETELFIDQVELVAKGEGRDFPKFAAKDVKDISTIASFKTEKDVENVLSVAHGYSITKPFEFGYRRKADPNARPMADYIKKSSPFIQQEDTHYPAPRYSLVAGMDGRKALQAECMWAEEGQIVTVKTQGDVKANAFKFTLKPDYPAVSKGTIYSFESEGKKAHAVDFIVFVSPKGTDFPWHDIEATDELKQAFKESGYKGPGAKYDYLLTTDKVKCINVPDIRQAGSFGFYFARRHMAAGDWSTAIVPFADFVCVYGQGACKEMQLKQFPLSPENISAIGILAPYGTGHGMIVIDDISYVSVPGTPEELRSYWQVPDPAKVKMIKLPRFNRYGVSTMMTLGEDTPDYLK
ncbi:MAG TPA: hypothetical protein DCZ94_20830 [Lentisphaeria bacterium]|nr:MAG: hypothetical protein A2X48_09025 [Lentisphaerae bacterium GWF2_49_21]HBC89393.1 hypothetical protein [Lentisphaeria bacterium]